MLNKLRFELCINTLVCIYILIYYILIHTGNFLVCTLSKVNKVTSPRFVFINRVFMSIIRQT